MTIEADIIEWSNKLTEALRSLPPNHSAHNDRWYIGEWVIYGESRSFRDSITLKHDWVELIECVPRDYFMSSPLGQKGMEAGYCEDRRQVPLPSDWIFEPSGTATHLLPSKADQERIIEAIHDHVKISESEK